MFDLTPLYRSTVGFDRLASLLDNAGSFEAPTYPPYNIERLGEDKYRITMAVAGFGADDLNLEVKQNTLTVSGRKAETEDKATVLHRGIATRQFQRSFVLADGIEVLGAELNHGLLTIELERPRAENAVKTIPIRSADIQLGDARDRN